MDLIKTRSGMWGCGGYFIRDIFLPKDMTYGIKLARFEIIFLSMLSIYYLVIGFTSCSLPMMAPKNHKNKL